MRILVAEDDALARRLLAGVLKKFGHEVVEAADGREALAALCGSRAPRFAILDWMMPELSGEEVCRQIRAIPTSNPPYLIFLTGKDDEESVVKGLDAGANDYLKKPYKRNELRARIAVGERMLELQSDLNTAKDALHYEATHDALTGTLNRKAILDILDLEFARARRGDVPLSIALCDIDHFKKINDQRGHQVGDAALRDYTKVVLSELRSDDYFGRYGGEEFLIVARGSCSASNSPLFERVRQVVESTDIPQQEPVQPFTVSMGVANSTQADTVDVLLTLADEALYAAKRNGRNRVCFA